MAEAAARPTDHPTDRDPPISARKLMTVANILLRRVPSDSYTIIEIYRVQDAYTVNYIIRTRAIRKQDRFTGAVILKLVYIEHTAFLK